MGKGSWVPFLTSQPEFTHLLDAIIATCCCALSPSLATPTREKLKEVYNIKGSFSSFMTESGLCRYRPRRSGGSRKRCWVCWLHHFCGSQSALWLPKTRSGPPIIITLCELDVVFLRPLPLSPPPAEK